MTQTRRTQAERTASTRAALLDATVDTLVDKGYRRTTTTDVARRAGVSPGALLHHFPTKANLLAAAVGHLFDQRLTDFGKVMADLPESAARGDAAIDVLWSMFSGPTFTAWLELWVAARTDPELRAAVTTVDRDFVRASEEVFREVFAEETLANPDLPRYAVATVFTFLTGMATSGLVPGADVLADEELLAIFKMLVKPALPAAAEGNPS
ncbi:MAG TPA: TetR/AcrR family transcriptional regulator [Mycobacteriales bacterium]|nr:TetR/AcrR family transcriptional regulator [Mycobacteriales bacterium]